MFRCLSMNVSNELSRFAKHFYAIFLENQMLAGLAHYDSKAFIYSSWYLHAWRWAYPELQLATCKFLWLYIGSQAFPPCSLQHSNIRMGYERLGSKNFLYMLTSLTGYSRFQNNYFKIRSWHFGSSVFLLNRRRVMAGRAGPPFLSGRQILKLIKSG